MSRELSETEKSLLHLVRIGIHNDSSKSIQIKSELWDSIFNLANLQGVAGITFSAIQEVDEIDSDTAMDVLGISEDLYLQWLGIAATIENVYRQHESAISGLSAFYAKANIPMMLLKGYGLSLNYPQPYFRPCGDIDIWLMGKQKEADAIMRSQTNIVPKKSSHHTIFSWDDCHVENHITLLEYDTHKSNIKLDKEITEMANGGYEQILVLGNPVRLPSAAFNSCFLLKHNALHFAVERITLRHLLDWATFVQNNSTSINWDHVYSFASRSHSDVFLNCQNAICVQYLGFSQSLFPIRKEYPELTNRILADILHPEFDEVAPNMKLDFINYCKVKTKRLIANRWKSEITNSDSLISTFFYYGINRIKESIFGLRNT